jgi:hypothetical protein
MMADARRLRGRIGMLAAALVAAAGLSACSSYDYYNHLDRVSFAGGNAVRANLEMQTADPARATSRKVTGLGRNGKVVPDTVTTPEPAPGDGAQP